jgi:hypothetical protein
MLAYLYWLLAVVLMAWAQGWLMPAIRRTPPGPEAKRQDVALHILLTAVYVLPLFLLLVLDLPGKLVATHALTMAGARLLFFDPVLNLAAGYPPFAVGQTAASDRALQWLAQHLNMEPAHLRLLLWLFCVVLAVCLLVIVNS